MKGIQGQRASNFQGEEMESVRKVCNELRNLHWHLRKH